jgi:hypothetical protein
VRRRERHRSGWNEPGHHDSSESASVHGGILLHQAASLLRRDAEDRQPSELIIHQRACCQQMSGLVQVHKV